MNFRLALSIAAFSLIACFLVSTGDAADFYVAPNGRDTWSGKRAAPSWFRSDGPFATLARAQQAARQAPKPVTIHVRSGTYYLDKPLVFTAEDSGLTIAAYRKEQPVISGGRRITGWKEVTVEGKKLWSTGVSTNWYFHQLWVNGERRRRARSPNRGYFKIAELPDVTKDTPRYPGQKRFQFAPGEIKQWRNLDDVDVVALHLWVSVRFAIASVDEQQHIVTFTHASRRTLKDGAAPAQYYVENALELLDAPGEWYLNRQTGTLYYWPLPGEDMNAAEVVAPVLTQIVRLENVERVTLRSLTFSHNEWWPARTDPADMQASVSVPGAIYGEGVRNCRFDSCRLMHLGTYALELSRGCQSNVIANCEITDLGAGGVKIGETAIRKNRADQTHGNEITDCHIHDGGKIFHQAIGVWIGQSYDNRVVTNHIHDFYYSGISVGWTWGYGPALGYGNLIESNHVHHIGRLANGDGPILSDMGGIYTLGKQTGTVIRHNRFHDIAGLRYGGWGIYFDEGTAEILAEKNVVYRTTHGGFHQHYGKENVVRNNIFAFGRDQQLQRSRVEDHLSFTFERNIVYWDDGKLFAGDWAKNVRVISNLYWRTEGKFADPNLLVADPLFAAPDKDDFTLRRDSPATKIGFQP